MKTKLNLAKRNFLSFKNLGSLSKLRAVRYAAALSILLALTQLSPFGGTEGGCQNVGIGTNTPDPSALLELSDTTRGILIPRTDTTKIASPANGLLIYQTLDSAFYYFNGIIWVRALGPAGADGIDGATGPTGPPGPAGAGPPGIIVMWSGLLANIPAGWALCDGTSGTPDLRDRFIYGASVGQNPGAIGGATSHAHSISNKEVFFGPVWGNVSYFSPSLGARVTQSGGWILVAWNQTMVSQFERNPPSAFTSEVSWPKLQLDPNTVASSAPHIPPYFKLAFIMKL